MKFSDDNPLPSAAEDIGTAAKEAIRQRDRAKQERDEFRTECVLWRRWATHYLGGGAASDKEQRDLLDRRLVRVAELEEELADTRMRSGQLGDEVTALHGRLCDLEATNEDIRGRVFDVDLRDAIHVLLKQELTAGELRRALGELVR